MYFIKKQKWEVPLYMIAAGLPIIIYFHAQYTGMEHLPWFPNQEVWTDFFLYGKSKVVHFTALLMALILIADAVRKKNAKFGLEWLWVVLLGALQLLSAFSSIAPRQSFLGGIEQYESIWVLTGYLIIGAYAYQRTIKSENPEWIMYALFVGVCLSCLIGITQLVQQDFWESGIGKNLLVPEQYKELRENMRFNFSQGNWQPVYLASYNPNYAGIYLLMLLPCIALQNNKYTKILTMLVLVCIVGTLSKTVFLASIILVMIGLILFRKVVDKKWKSRIGKTGIILVLLLILVAIYEKRTISFEYENKLQGVVCEEDHVKIVYQGETILLRDIPLEEGENPYLLIRKYTSYAIDNNQDPPVECNVKDTYVYELHISEADIKKANKKQ